MYANTGYNASWAYSNEDDHNVDYYDSPSQASDADSTQDIDDLEELLYSHIHYEPNHLYMTGASDDHSYSDVQITQLHDGTLDRVDIAASPTKQEHPITSFISDDEVVIIDVIPSQDELRKINSTATVSLSSRQLKRKTASCKTSKLVDEIKTKSKKVDATSSANSIAEVGLLNDDAAGTGRPGGKKVCGADGQHVADNKLKVKQKSRIISDVETVKPVVVDSDSESTSDAFCCDLSSDELTSDGVPDDIKLSNINVDLPQTSDADALADVLNSLPDCNWEVSAQDRAAGTPNISRYYTQTTSKARCINCSERGHLARDCPLPKKLLACMLCGVRGHVARSCAASLCFNCHQPGHAVRDCDRRRRIRSEICRRCRMRGHIQMECPDLWRQYHLTTSPGPLVTAKSEKVERKFCYNCGVSGHFGHECDEDRMDSYSLPTLPFIARYDTHDATKSPSTPHHKKQNTNTDVREHRKEDSHSRHQHHTHKGKGHGRNVQTVHVKAQSSHSNSHHDFRDIHSRTGNLSHGDHHISAADNKEGKHRRSSSSSRVSSDTKHGQKDSFSSKHRWHLSTDVMDDRFRDRINGEELVCDGCKSAHRRSNDASSGNEPNVPKSKEIDPLLFRESSSRRAFKQRAGKKSRFFDSLHHDASRKEMRNVVKTPVHIAGSAKHTKKTPSPSSVKHKEFRNKVASYDGNVLETDRKVVRTARGFLMTVDNC